MGIRVSWIPIMLEMLFAGFSIFLMIGAVFPLLSEQISAFGFVNNLFKAGMYFGIMLIIVLRLRLILNAVKKNKLILILSLWAMLSIFWSDVWKETAVSSFKLLLTTLYAFYLGSRFQLEDFLKILLIVLGLTVVTSYLFSLFLPSYGVDHDVHAGAWKGVFAHKNSLGRSMVLSLMVFLVLGLASKKKIYWVGFALSLALLLLSTSKTALVIFLVLMLSVPLFKALRWRFHLVIPFIILVLISGGIFLVWFIDNVEMIFGLLGRDLTLTGRTVLWEASWYMISQQPWLGYGLSAFWRGLDGPSAYVWLVAGWEVPHSHNGLIDLWLDLGFIGVALFVSSFVWNYFIAMNFVRRHRSDLMLFPIIYLSYLFLYNFTESSLFYNNVFWFFYVVSVTLISSRLTASATLSSREAELKWKQMINSNGYSGART